MFYVLVVGRLPFLSSKQEGLTHQERRDRLIAHINQGLGGTHRSDMKHLGSGERTESPTAPTGRHGQSL